MFGKVGNDLYLSRGDTGNLRIRIASAYATTSYDRILFTVKDKENPVIVQVLTPENNEAVLQFTNEMTEELPAKDYEYDIRIFINAVLDSDDIPIDGDIIRTPFKPAVFHLLKTVGDT